MSDYPWLLQMGAGDVRLNPAEQMSVYGSPVFLSPKAQSVTVTIGVSAIEKMVAGAQEAKVIGENEALGRQAIGHVVKCRPTLYKKLLATCNIINWHYVSKLHRPAPIVSEDIIVCGFRIRDFGKISKALGVTEASLAKEANVDIEFVKALSGNYRLHLDPVLKVREALFNAAFGRSVTGEGEAEVKRLQTGELRNVIIVDRKPFVNIKKLGTDDNGEDRYLLDENNIVSAPAESHPWSVGQRKPPPAVT